MITRKIYKRGSISYATTLPRQVLLDAKQTKTVYFEYSNKKWHLSFEKKSGLNIFSRKIYKRSSFEVTLPSEILFGTKKKLIKFIPESKKWRIKIE